MSGKTTNYFSIGSSENGKELISAFKSFLVEGYAYKNEKRHLLFVCGGDTRNGTLFRKQFLDYAEGALSQYQVFLAEDTFNALLDIQNDVTHNLALFENLLCEISDCVIIFPESPGSFCEVGFFATSEALRKKSLIVNDHAFHASESFLNNGPIALIDKETKFSSQINLMKDSPNFQLIKERLDAKLKISTRRKVFEDRPYAEMSYQDKLFLVCEIIKLFGPCSVLSIEEILRGLFKAYKREDVSTILAILMGGRFINPLSVNGDFYSLAPGIETFISYSGDKANNFRAKVLEHYQAHNLMPNALLMREENEI